MKEKDKHQFLELLDDPEIKMKIISIASAGISPTAKESSDGNDSQLSDKYNMLKHKYNELKKHDSDILSELEVLREKYQNSQSEINSLQDSNKDSENEISKLNGKIKEMLEIQEKLQAQTETLKEKEKNAEELLNNIKSTFDGVIRCFEKYKKLSDDVRHYLLQFISDKDEIHFISSCTILVNLEKIWDHAKDMYLLGQDQDAEILTDIFYYCFNVFVQSSPKADYRLDDSQAGQQFDDDKHAKGTNSRSSGNISEVLLQGFYSVNTGKFIKHTLVIV